MRKTFLYLVLCTFVLLIAACGAKRSQAFYDQKSVLLSANYDGSYVLRVQIRARNASMAFIDAQRKAVQEVIFDGVKAGNTGISDLKPLCFDLNAREKYEQYWNAFFQNDGEWTKYASLADKRAGTTRYQRDGRQMVETVTVTVDRAGLQQKLREDGIIPAQGRY